MQANWYERHLLPAALDFACGMPMIARMRQLVVPRAQGRVLEVGIGTGLNMRYYDKQRVSHITGLDPALQMHPLAQQRIDQAGLQVDLIGLSAEKISLPDASFDTVLITYTLCTIPDPHAALLEMRRVLAPGGRLLYCEHGRAPDASVQRWQARLQPLWGSVAGGCHLGRDMPALLQAAGFALPDLQTRYLPGPRPFTFHYWGEALPLTEQQGTVQGMLQGPLVLQAVNSNVYSVHSADGGHVGNLKLIGAHWKFKAVGYDAAGAIEPGGGPLTHQHNMVFAQPDATEVSARLLAGQRDSLQNK